MSDPLALAGMKRDMQPLAYAQTVRKMSEAAERGALEQVRTFLESLPLAIQLNPDIRALIDRARTLGGDPETADEERIGEVHRAMAQGNFEEAISRLRELIPSGHSSRQHSALVRRPQ